jgi:hypothetical protein
MAQAPAVLTSPLAPGVLPVGVLVCVVAADTALFGLRVGPTDIPQDVYVNFGLPLAIIIA